MRHWAAMVGLLAMVASCGALRAAEDERRPPEIFMTSPPQWGARAYYPVDMSVRTYEPERLTMTLSSGRWRGGQRLHYQVRRTVTLPAGTSARLEFSHIGAAQPIVEDRAGQVLAVSGNHFFPTYLSSQLKPLLLVDGFESSAAMAAKEKLSTTPGLASWRGGLAEPVTLALEQLPRRWQNYAGLNAPLVFAAADLRRLDRERAETLVRGIQYLGARVVIVGPDAPGAARDALGFDPAPERAEAETPEGERRFPWMMGKVSLLDAYDADAWADASRIAALGQGPLVAYDAAPPAGLSWMIDLFPGLSSLAMVGLLALLGIVLGPLNYWFVRRRDNLILFFVTAPLLAVAGALVIFGVSVFAEGVSTKYAEAAVLLRRADDAEGMMIHHRLVHTGLFTPRLVYADETLLLPFRQGEEALNVAVDDTDQLRLSGDWITPRTLSGLKAMYPVTARLDVEIVEEGGRLFAVNQLPHRIRRLLVRRPEGWLAAATVLEPGERAPLAPGDDDMREVWNRAIGDAGGLLGGLDAARVELLAECAGLPYLQDGRLGGTLIEGRYYYVVAE